MTARSCDALGVFQRRAVPCAGCSHGVHDESHDTRELPPGKYYFAPGTIEEPPKPERWSPLEIVLAIICLAAAGGAVVGLLRVLIARAAL